nr:immunoglobulin light chain junction region [Macaca mulatta]MOW66155.1 immunoglobulin light chain junction region [Macaca mulatta]MOW66206.1 immunoglobulin light chain junction region [Macaca mulatta]MOW66213.1 immunoglobulin light chain junction region [Macaca mulatta]MOW66391.1 immunoglobulin light chain junction region [Macaca mulatta]
DYYCSSYGGSNTFLF